MKINICALSDVGKERPNNEDAISVCPDLTQSLWNCFSANSYVPLSSLGAVCIIADGMGGANAGEIASSLAIENIEESFRKADYENIMASDNTICNFLRDCIAQSDKRILNYTIKHPDSFGLGTTIVLLWIVNGKAFIAWCGDSRCYCFNPKSGLRLLTKDHSLVQELVDKGEIQAEEAFCHPDNSIVTRCLGDVGANPEPETLTHNIENGDLFLLCSDGLCGYCRDSKMEKVIYKHYDNIDECQRALLQLALKAGGEDNISIALCATQPEVYTNSKSSFIGKLKRLITR